MKLISAFFSLAVVCVGTLVLASPAQAAAGPVPVTVCGDSTTWYVNGDEAGSDPKQGDRRPLSTRDGLLFYPRDLIHHQLNFDVTPGLVAGIYTTFPGSPLPDLPDFFSVEVANDDGSGYATLRWNEVDSKWSVTVSGNTTEGDDPAALLTAQNKSLHGRSFGVGYTNAPPGTAVSLVTSISFMNVVYKLSCSIATITPSPVAVLKTVIKTVTVTPSPDPYPTEGPDPSHASSDQPTVSTQDPSPTSDPTEGTHSTKPTLAGYGIATVGVVGVILVILGVAGIARKRRAPGRHSVDNSETTMMPAVEGDDHDMSDYGPGAAYDPALGGYAGESRYEQGDDTEPQPPVR